MRLAALGLVLLLGGCGGPGLSQRQQDEAIDIANDAAAEAVSESERIADLEMRIEELEARLGV